jgi:hypothetical protein
MLNEMVLTCSNMHTIWKDLKNKKKPQSVSRASRLRLAQVISRTQFGNIAVSGLGRLLDILTVT